MHMVHVRSLLNRFSHDRNEHHLRATISGFQTWCHFQYDSSPLAFNFDPIAIWWHGLCLSRPWVRWEDLVETGRFPARRCSSKSPWWPASSVTTLDWGFLSARKTVPLLLCRPTKWSSGKKVPKLPLLLSVFSQIGQENLSLVTTTKFRFLAVRETLGVLVDMHRSDEV